MRRALRLAMAALALASAAAAAQPAVPITPAEEFPACLARLRTFATGQGIREGVVNGALRSVEYDPTVLDSMTRQPEFQTPIWDYMAGLVDERRIVDGRIVQPLHVPPPPRSERQAPRHRSSWA